VIASLTAVLPLAQYPSRGKLRPKPRTPPGSRACGG